MASCTLFCDHNPKSHHRAALAIFSMGHLRHSWGILGPSGPRANPDIDQAGGGPAEKSEAGHYVIEGMAFQCHHIEAFQHPGPVEHVQSAAILPLAPNGTEHSP